MSIGGFKIKRVILGPLEPDERSPLLSTSRDVAPRFQIKCVHPSTGRQMSTRHNLGPEFGLNSESTRKYKRGRGHKSKRDALYRTNDGREEDNGWHNERGPSEEGGPAALGLRLDGRRYIRALCRMRREQRGHRRGATRTYGR